jgi:hypothetical protein
VREKELKLGGKGVEMVLAGRCISVEESRLLDDGLQRSEK